VLFDTFFIFKNTKFYGILSKNQKAEMSFTNKIASDISALSAALSDILQTQDKYTIWG
jgi:hypothetical protein